MRNKVTIEDLEWLERQGYWVDPSPVVLPDERRFYDVDGMPCSEERIVLHLTEGRKLYDAPG